MEKSSPRDLIDVLFKGEVIVKNESKVAYIRGGEEGGAVNSKAEVADGVGFGFWTNDD